jgi:hypothetical protein
MKEKNTRKNIKHEDTTYDGHRRGNKTRRK